MSRIILQFAIIGTRWQRIIRTEYVTLQETTQHYGNAVGNAAGAQQRFAQLATARRIAIIANIAIIAGIAAAVGRIYAVMPIIAIIIIIIVVINARLGGRYAGAGRRQILLLLKTLLVLR